MREHVTIYRSAPTVFRLLADGLSPKYTFPDLRIIRLGGEPLCKRDVELYKHHFPSTSVCINNLSCTEAFTYRQFFINHETEVGDSVPVGYPVYDKDVSIVDEQGNDLGFSRAGEIVVRSRYLALGYWKQREATRESFSSASDNTERRAYRTGDLGRMLPDGCLEYLGRRDSHVRIRGIGVDLTAVEMALLNCRQIKQAAVDLEQRGFEDDEQQLTAYIVPVPGKRVSVRDLRRTLRKTLPNQMLPRSFVRLESLPQIAQWQGGIASS